MGALDAFLARGVRFELLAGDQLKAIGTLDENLRADIKATKPAIIGELLWAEFETLLAIVGPAYRAPEHEYAEMRAVARGDLPDALIAYREMAAQIKDAQRNSDHNVKGQSQ